VPAAALIPFSMPRALLRSSPAAAELYSWLHGTRLRSEGGGHQVQRHDAILRHTRIEMYGTGCRLVIGPGARLWDCSLTIAGDDTQLFIGAGCQLRSARLNVEDRGSRLVIGAQTSIIGATLVSQEGRLLELGEDCMLAQHADLRNSDSHAIYDAQSVRINPARDILVGQHVWIGLGARVFNGARIGDGAVIGALALVTGGIPASTLAYGVPAVPRRTAIRWDRSRLPPDSPAAP
jgi:acetyltransferase-like isoleucine patch superfamily enzyme